jgi:hypothetical protein
MRIANWRLQVRQDTSEVSADIDDFRLWYRIPATYSVSRAGDPFLAAAFLPAMAGGQALEVEPNLPVSPKLLENLSLLQEIHHCWNPALKIIPVSAETAATEPVNKGVISFFSGGVDSMFTVLMHDAEISHAVFIHGFDFFAGTDSYRRAVARNSSFVEGFGKTLIPVETNFYPFGYSHNLSRVLTQGSTLASVALLLGYPRAYIPSSSDYDDLIPLGTHPLTDPLYSTEAVEIVHDGAEAKRTDKVARIAACEPALAALRVCLEDMNVNCGRCAKCLRTMAALELLGQRPPSFPWPLSAGAIRRADWSQEPVALRHNIEFAAGLGHPWLLKALRARQRRYKRIRLLKEIDRILLGGVVKGAFRIFSRSAATSRRIGVVPPKD